MVHARKGEGRRYSDARAKGGGAREREKEAKLPFPSHSALRHPPFPLAFLPLQFLALASKNQK